MPKRTPQDWETLEQELRLSLTAASQAYSQQ
jgi:hypothetical protein